MSTINTEIRQQLLKIIGEQINAVNDLQILTAYKLKNKLDDCVETYRNDIYAAFAEYINVMNEFSPTTHMKSNIVANPYKIQRQMEAQKKFEKSFLTIMKKLGQQRDEVIKIQLETAIETLKELCKKFDERKKEAAPDLFSDLQDTVSSVYFMNNYNTLPVPGLSFSTLLKLSTIQDIFTGDSPLWKRVLNLFTGSNEAEINAETEKIISQLKELVNKQASEVTEKVFKPVFDKLSELGKI